MSYENKGSMATTVMVSLNPDRSGNFVCSAVEAHDVTIQRAIDYVSTLGGGTIYIKRGTYDITAELVDAGVSDIEIHMNKDACLKAATNLNLNVFHLTTVARWEIHGGEIDGNKANQDGTPDGVQMCGILGTGVTDSKFHDIYIHDCKQIGIWVYSQCYDIYMYNNRLIDNAWNGIEMGLACARLHADDNYVEGSSDVGITVYSPDSSVRGNTIKDITSNDGDANSHWGIGIEGAGPPTDIQVTDNLVTGCGIGIIIGGVGGTASDIQINNNQVKGSSTNNIEVASASTNIQINGNQITDVTGWQFGIIVTAALVDSEIDDNQISGAANHYAVYVGYGGTINNSSIQGNDILDAAAVGIFLDGDSNDNLVQGNMILTASIGIEIDDSTGNDNRVIWNDYGSCTTMIVDDGTDTVLQSKPFQFTHVTGGSAAVQVTSPVGCYVSDAGGTAIVWGQIPKGAQQVVRLKIWAVAKDAPVNAGGHMHCEFTFNAGAANAAYNTAGKSWGIANKDSEDADYVADDVIHWVLTDVDTGDSEVSALVAGDSFELLAIYEGAADPDGDTDAKFRVVEVEYV